MIWENFLGLLDKEKWHVQGKKICKYQDYFLHFVYLCLFINAQIRYIYRVTYYIFELLDLIKQCYLNTQANESEKEVEDTKNKDDT